MLHVNKMEIIINNKELKSYIKDGVISFDCDIKCNFDIDVEADIKAWDIYAMDIKAWDIDARNIDACNINACNINARDDICARSIDASSIKAWDIDAWSIKAWDINYYAVCFARESFKCRDIKGRRDNSKHFCLDSEIEYTK